MKPVTRNLLICLFLNFGLSSLNANADTASMKLFANNAGTFTGKLSDGGTCFIKVSESRVEEGYTIEMTGEGFSQTAYVNSESNTKNYFDKSWFDSYASAKNGGWLNSRFQITDQWEMRVYFKDKKIASYAIIYKNSTISCQIQ